MQIEVRQKPSGNWTVCARGWPVAHEATEQAARETFADSVRLIVEASLARATVIIEREQG